MTSETEIRSLLKDMAAKHCPSDPSPTWLVKQCLSPLARVYARIVNLSQQGCEVPAHSKVALVRPLLKKPGLDRDILQNDRPVSNLAFTATVLEREVAKRLVHHLSTNGLRVPFQSAYVSQHSTETALIRVHNDICRAVDANRAAVLALLDLSSAVDTIDHGMLLTRLESSFGITDDALMWIRSYLSNRYQSVTINSETSSQQPYLFGVPQGSVLGPIPFT